MEHAPKVVGGREDIDRMNHMQHVIEKAILPYRENTEAVVVAGALLRVARILLRLYKPDLSKLLVEAGVAFLRGQAQLGEEDRNQSELRKLGFWVPPGSTH